MRTEPSSVGISAGQEGLRFETTVKEKKTKKL